MKDTPTRTQTTSSLHCAVLSCCKNVEITYWSLTRRPPAEESTSPEVDGIPTKTM